MESGSESQGGRPHGRARHLMQLSPSLIICCGLVATLGAAEVMAGPIDPAHMGDGTRVEIGEPDDVNRVEDGPCAGSAGGARGPCIALEPIFGDRGLRWLNGAYEVAWADPRGVLWLGSNASEGPVDLRAFGVRVDGADAVFIAPFLADADQGVTEMYIHRDAENATLAVTWTKQIPNGACAGDGAMDAEAAPDGDEEAQEEEECKADTNTFQMILSRAGLEAVLAPRDADDGAPFVAPDGLRLDFIYEHLHWTSTTPDGPHARIGWFGPAHAFELGAPTESGTATVRRAAYTGMGDRGPGHWWFAFVDRPDENGDPNALPLP
ncbi:MAG: hypothetical protein KC620_05535, partial [Myxococcales bacterium]|nr:hypothetical protein [Myxococcales bacterium]